MTALADGSLAANDAAPKDWDDVSLDKAGLQEAALSHLLHQLQFTSVLDVGCGSGRLTGLILGNWPRATYIGFDPSAPRLAIARARFPHVQFGRAAILELDPMSPPPRPPDLVLCVQVLMHLPPAEFVRSVDRLKAITRRHLVTLDRGDARAAHDYESVLGPPVGRVGLQALYHWQRES